MNHATTYRPQEACNLIGLPRGTLDTWGGRGYFRSFDAAQPIVGRSREFTITDVLALALIKEASDRGINLVELPDSAPHYARLFLQNRGKIRECVVRYYGLPNTKNSLVSILPNDDAFNEQVDPGARTTIRFDLEAIFGPVLRAIETQEG